MTTDDQKHKMLILEDEEGNLNFLKMLFRDDYRVVEAGDYDKALEELNKPGNNDIAIIIADKKLPYLTGIQFLKEAKEKLPHAIRVFITAYPDINDMEVLVNNIGIDLIYFKPLTDTKIEELKLRLKIAVKELEMHKIKDLLFKVWQEEVSKKSI